MSPYILILILYMDRAVSMQEFSSKEKCEAAITVIEKRYYSVINHERNHYYCVEK